MYSANSLSVYDLQWFDGKPEPAKQASSAAEAATVLAVHEVTLITDINYSVTDLFKASDELATEAGHQYTADEVNATRTRCSKYTYTPTSIFGDQTFKWRPVEYIACLNPCRHSLQHAEDMGWCQDHMWKNWAFPTTFSQQLLKQADSRGLAGGERKKKERRAFFCLQTLNGSLIFTVPLACTSWFVFQLKVSRRRCPLLAHVGIFIT